MNADPCAWLHMALQLQLQSFYFTSHTNWLHLCSSESSSTILELMKEALYNAEAGSSLGSYPASNEVACEAAFRLASYAESLYRAVQEQISSPKWATAVAIIQDKKRQARGSTAFAACVYSAGKL
jgi:hypothetical protein